MSKTKEFIIAVFFFILGFMAVQSMAKADEVKCYANADFMKFIDSNKLITLYNTVKGKEVQEVLMSMERRLYVVEYEKGTEGASSAKSYCIVATMNDVTFNDNAIELLFGLLEKMKGQKI